jgi:hypothetical protein
MLTNNRGLRAPWVGSIDIEAARLTCGFASSSNNPLVQTLQTSCVNDLTRELLAQTLKNKLVPWRIA